MRRRWGIRFGRREPRPPRSVEDQQRRQRGYLVLVTLALGLALWAILAFRPPATPGLQPGSPSPVDIRARRSVTFVSASLTEQERLRAERSTDATVYTSDPNIPIQQRAQLVDMLQAMTQIRDNTSLTQAQKRDKITSVPLPNSTLVISPALATQILRLSGDSWGVVRQQSLGLYDQAMTTYGYELNDQAVAQLRERSLPYWSTLGAKGEEQQLALLFSESFIRANRVLDEAATQKRQQDLRGAVKPVSVTVQENESIVRAGEIVTPAIQEKLEALGELQGDVDWVKFGGKGLLAALIAVVLGVYLFRSQHDVWMTTRPLLVVAGLFAITALAARLVVPRNMGWSYGFPLAITALLLTTLFNRNLAFVAATLLSMLIGFLDDGRAALATALLLGSMAGVLMVGRGDRSLAFVVAGMVVAVVTALALLAFWLVSAGGPLSEEWLPILIFSGINGVLSAIAALGLYNLIGHLADVVTPMQLMELAHPAHPLLRKLIREAPGTYYHSVSVGNLAESAAEAIGADALLLRVASYYHDIGKTMRPYFFTDNQSDRENVHNELDPHTSAEIICEHVREGVKMARQAGLPRQVVEFIPAHHGTSVMQYFYQLAVQQEDSVNVDDFRYPGPKPRTREQGIMMLADSVEATVRSKAQNGKIASARDDQPNGNGRGQGGLQTLEELVSSIVDDRITSGQLDESALTLHDIARIREAFVKTLQGIYHPRVDYAPQLVKHS